MYMKGRIPIEDVQLKQMLHQAYDYVKTVQKRNKFNNITKPYILVEDIIAKKTCKYM